MIAFSIILFLFIAVMILFPVSAMRKRQKTTWWDYVYPFTGIVAWFPLGISNVGSIVSLSNFVVEVFFIAVISVIMPWVRWLLSKTEKEQIKALSFSLTILPIVTAVIIRLTMPTLPE